MAPLLTIRPKARATLRSQPAAGATGLRSDASSPALWTGAAVVAPLASAFAVNLFALVVTWHPMPFWDHWETVVDYQWARTSGLTWDRLFAQHNEHRIVPSRILNHADYAFFGGMGASLQLVSALLSIASVFLLLRAARSETLGFRGATRALAALAIGTSVAQLGNLAWSFQTAWFLVLAFAILAIAAYASVADRQTSGHGVWVRASAAWAAAAVSTFSNGNGQLVWIVLVLLGALYRYPKRVQAATAAVAAAVLAFHYSGYHHPPNHPPIWASLAQPVALAEFAVRCAASAFGRLPRWPQIVVGTALFGIVAAELVAAALRRDHARRPGAPALLGALLFLAGSIGATALGRAGMEGGASYANETRYATYSVFLVVAALVALVLRLEWPRAREHALAPVLAAATLLMTWSGLGRPYREALAIRDAKLQVAACEASGHCPAEVLRRVYPLDGLVERLAFLRAERLGPFTDPSVVPATTRGSVNLDPRSVPECTGFVDTVERSHEGTTTVTGWMVWPTTRERPVAVTAVSRDGAVVGGGGVCEPRVDVQRHLGVRFRGRHRLFGFRAWTGPGATPASIVGTFGQRDRSCSLRVPDAPAGSQ
jgi:hypothetical protein